MEIIELEKHSLKKVHKTWDNAVSQEIVYGPKTIRKAVPLTWPFIAKNYVEKKLWFEMFLRTVGNGNFQDYIAVIESANIKVTKLFRPLITQIFPHTSEHTQCDNGEVPMLFDTPERMQSPQGVILRPLPSTIWLESLDNLTRLGWHTSRHSLENLGIRHFKYGETSVVGRATLINDYKLPSQVLQGRPQVVNNITCQQINLNRNVSRGLVPIYIDEILHIEFGRN
jgi:hypothetical protein